MLNLKFIIAAAVLLGALGYLGFIAFQSATVYSYTVSELTTLGPTPEGKLIRVSGSLVEDTFVRPDGSTMAHFTLTDKENGGVKFVAAQHDGVLPDLFFNPHSEIILEGSLRARRRIRQPKRPRQVPIQVHRIPRRSRRLRPVRLPQGTGQLRRLLGRNRPIDVEQLQRLPRCPLSLHRHTALQPFAQRRNRVRRRALCRPALLSRCDTSALHGIPSGCASVTSPTPHTKRSSASTGCRCNRTPSAKRKRASGGNPSVPAYDSAQFPPPQRYRQTPTAAIP